MQGPSHPEEIIVCDSVNAARNYRQKGDYDSCVRELDKGLARVPQGANPYLHNLILNELEISTGRSLIESKPRGMGIALTNRCNIRCIMCNVWNNPWDLPEKTVREVMAFLPYLQRIFWQGGEVFLSPFFEELFEKVTSYPQIRQDINTNGLLIDRQWAEKLVKANANIIVSIDGVTSRTYEYIRRGARFSDLLKSIDLLNEFIGRTDRSPDRKNSSSIVINLVLMKSNYRELGDFIDFARQYGFDRLQITPVDLKSEENIFLHKDQDAMDYIERIMPEVIAKARDYGICVSNWLPQTGTVKEGQERQESGCAQGEADAVRVNNRVSCYWPWQFLFIDWGGRVRPQCFCAKPLGNIHDSSIGDIWNGQVAQLYRRKLFDNDVENWCDARCVSGSMPKESLGLD